MSPLRELQFRFVASLFEDTPKPIAPWLVEGDIEADSRIAIYRNNLRVSFAKTLALEFPVIERLVGQSYFAQLAREYLAEHPSRAGNLHFIGSSFACFLRHRFGHTGYRYLSDVAQLEWAYQEAMIASEQPSLDPRSLEKFSPEHYAKVGFCLQSACRLLRTAFPVIRIWRVNQPDCSSTEQIDLRAAADLILVRRSANGVEFIVLPPGQFAFLEALYRGLALGDAHDLATAVETAFDLREALHRFVTLGVFTSAYLIDSSPKGVC